MIKNISIVYECVSAIGNSLELQEMIEEVLKTFALKSGAIGAQFVSKNTKECIYSIGKNFITPDPLSQNVHSFELHEVDSRAYILDIALGDENLLFYYKFHSNLEYIGNMFSSFRLKLNNAIYACKNVEQLRAHNIDLATKVEAQQKQNELNEQMMINQSRMAVMGEMISMIAHQWRQPITIIGMIANNTILDVELDEINSSKLLEDLESINYQVGYLSQTIDDFRNFFRPDKFHSNISTDELYTDLLSILGNSLEQHNIKIIVSGDTKERFNTYKNELVQVFLNIITNAKDAFIENKIADAKIYFTCEKQGEVMYFSIEDNAGGIPKEVLPKIFDPYFTTKALSHGTGIGLYMSYTIITNHLGGTVDVSSKDGKTTFMIQLPKLTLSDELTDASK